MTTEELERAIEGQAETQNLDFKADMPWSPQDLAKDFIAMSNLRDGGTIIIGVSENDRIFVGTGVCDSNLKTYNIDHMKDKLFAYTDPSVEFTVGFPVDLNGKKYVVIRILPFKEVPVISKSSIPSKLVGHTIYYRNSNKRVESAAVSNSADLRDIIENAAIKLMRRRMEAGFSVTSNDNVMDTVNQGEVPKSKEIAEDGLLKLIKSKGHWQIEFLPKVPGKISNLKESLEIVSRARTRLNWDFPHVPLNNTSDEQALPLEDCYQAESDLGSRKEFWRIYLTEEFVVFRSLVEDWYEGDRFRSSLAYDNPEGTTLTIYTSLTLFLTEVFEFLSRLAENGLYKDGVYINLKLVNVKGRSLKIDASGRMPFTYERKTGAEKIEMSGTYTASELVDRRQEIANGFIMEAFDRFGYNPEPETFLKIQKDWLNGSFNQ